MAFDLRTQRLNKKGQIIAKTPYRLIVENGVHKFERPPGSKIFYAADGTLLSAPKTEAVVEPVVEKTTKHKKNSDMDDLKADILRGEK